MFSCPGHVAPSSCVIVTDAAPVSLLDEHVQNIVTVASRVLDSMYFVFISVRLRYPVNTDLRDSIRYPLYASPASPLAALERQIFSRPHRL